MIKTKPSRMKLKLKWIWIFVPVIVLLSHVNELDSHIETLLINTNYSQIQTEKNLKSANNNNRWASVRLLSILSVIKARFTKQPAFVGSIFSPGLHMYLPLANYTNNQVYTLGAGMLKPKLIESNAHYVIGAHNVGPHSTALFSPLAVSNTNSLIGKHIYLTNFQTVKEYVITSRNVINASQVIEAFKDSPLTLITCTPDNNNRFLIRGKLIKQFSYHRLSPRVQKKLTHRFNY